MMTATKVAKVHVMLCMSKGTSLKFRLYTVLHKAFVGDSLGCFELVEAVGA